MGIPSLARDILKRSDHSFYSCSAWAWTCSRLHYVLYFFVGERFILKALRLYTFHLQRWRLMYIQLLWHFTTTQFVEECCLDYGYADSKSVFSWLFTWTLFSMENPYRKSGFQVIRHFMCEVMKRNHFG